MQPNVLINLCGELWQSLLRVGSPRLTPNALAGPPRPRRWRRQPAAGCPSLCVARLCASPCAHTPA